MDKSLKPKISIVIPTLNEQEYIGRLLHDVYMNNYENLEVIVSDNGSTDSTLKVAESYSKNINNLEIVTLQDRGVSKARNNGAKNAKGEYILFLDADSRVSEEYIRKTLMEMQKRDLAIANHYMTAISNNKKDIFMVKAVNNILKLMQHIIPGGPGGGGIIIEKSLHENIGGFNENIMTIGEDVDYQYRASKMGKFRMLDSEKTYIDMRRFDKEGRLKTWMKWSTAYAMHLSRIKMSKFPAQYTFGTY